MLPQVPPATERSGPESAKGVACIAASIRAPLRCRARRRLSAVVASRTRRPWAPTGPLLQDQPSPPGKARPPSGAMPVRGAAASMKARTFEAVERTAGVGDRLADLFGRIRQQPLEIGDAEARRHAIQAIETAPEKISRGHRSERIVVSVAAPGFGISTTGPIPRHGRWQGSGCRSRYARPRPASERGDDIDLAASDGKAIWASKAKRGPEGPAAAAPSARSAAAPTSWPACPAWLMLS